MSTSEPTDERPRPIVAFHDPDFMKSSDARTIRIVSEYIEPFARFRRLNVKNTVVFFGSARSHASEDAQARLSAAKTKLKNGGSSPESQEEYEAAKRMVRMER